MFDFITWNNPVAIWWVFLTLASIFNILLWLWTRFYSFKDHSIMHLKDHIKNNRNIIWFSGIYVFVCAFRSIMPRADVQRIVFFDSWWSSVFVGRTVATIAELAFVACWVIVIRFMSVQVNCITSKKISYSLLPLITIAECCSWYAVIRTHYIGNVIEESLWAFTYILVLIALYRISKKLVGPLFWSCSAAIVGCFFYVIFMLTVDVPMYVNRFMQDNLNQKPLLGLWNGLVDLNTRWIVTHSIEDWKTEIPWQTLYFTFAVLVSVALCYVPLTQNRIKKYTQH